MEKLSSSACCRVILCGAVTAILLIVECNAVARSRQRNLSCLQILFSGPENDYPNNLSELMECSCENKTQITCPKLSSKPLTMVYSAFNREIRFSCTGVNEKFEVVIRHIGKYIKLAQPYTLRMSMCYSRDVPRDESLEPRDDSSHITDLPVLHVKDIPSPSTLRLLELNDNCFGKVRGKFNSSFSNLNELDLSTNLFTEFPEGTFSALKELHKLSLSRNRIRNLTRFTFEGLTNLRDLRLESNKIEELPEDVFKELRNLQYLHLGSNNLQKLPDGLFQSNREIRGVTFESNTLKTLPGTILSPLQKLVFFSVYSNHLESIPSEIFNDLIELQEVRLNNNQLRNIPADLFKTNGFLLNIDLSWNNLEEIPMLNLISFGGDPVESIRLLHNNITSVSLPIKNYISTYTERLDLSENCIQHFHLSETNNSKGDDSGIFHLICKRCCLRSINSKLLENVITSVDFSDNLITKLDMNVLKIFADIDTVDLSNNRITTLNVTPDYPLIKSFDDHRPYEGLKTKYTLRGNPVICDCNIMPFLKLIRHDFFPLDGKATPSTITFNVKDVSCAQPPALQIYTLWDFIPSASLAEKLMCNRIANCPEKCNCYFKALPAANVVNCSNLGIEYFPNIDNVQSPIELHLENNSIDRLPCKESSIWQKLSGLHLQTNRLKSIENLTLSPNLTTLRLQDNLLTKFDSSLQSLLSLQDITISLAQNPWECNCELQKMKNAIVLARNVDDFSQMTCKHPKNSQVLILANTTDYELCPLEWHNHILLRVLLSSAAAIVVTASLAAVMFFRYKDQLYLWLFKRGYCLGIVTEEDIDYTKLFDAFVSCSNKDDEWVASNLLPGLEKGTPSYSLCIHSRNWPVGGWIPDQIILSVQQSRRTIIILTENFLESHWSKLEFRTAYEQALTEPAVNRVLIIVPYDVPMVTDPVLSGFLKINTYIKWGDPHFWRKLRCAMPRIKPNIRKKASNLYYFTDKFVLLPANVKSSDLSV